MGERIVRRIPFDPDSPMGQYVQAVVPMKEDGAMNERVHWQTLEECANVLEYFAAHQPREREERLAEIAIVVKELRQLAEDVREASGDNKTAEQRAFEEERIRTRGWDSPASEGGQGDG